MTALAEYQFLEAAAIWRSEEGAQRRDVIVSFGEASLTISAGQDVPVSHWSLAAVTRLNPGTRPALFAPGPGHEETLEIEDDTMVDAIEKVRRAVTSPRPSPRRIRRIATSGLVALCVLFVLFWLPPAMVRYTASIIPDAKSRELGDTLLIEIEDLVGLRCNSALGFQALADLKTRLNIEGLEEIVVLPGGLSPSLMLPGGILLLDRGVVENQNDPHAAAGYVVAEALRMSGTDPLEEMLHDMGLGATLRLLTTGRIVPARLQTYAEELLAEPRPGPEVELLSAALSARAIPPAPYFAALGETPAVMPADSMSRPVLSDYAWVSLQSICSG